MKTIIPFMRSSINPVTGLAVIVLVIGWVALAQKAHAVTPAPDGGYPNGNTAEGTSALFRLTSGVDNTGLGFQALYHDTTGYYNTAIGFRALFSNTTGVYNTATGLNVLSSNTSGRLNTADGVNALFHNTTGFYNTGTGVNALSANTTGSNNTANGVNALYRNTTGIANTAVGAGALLNNLDGQFNNAIGTNALSANTSGLFNNAMGHAALQNNLGNANDAFGDAALFNNTTGAANTAVGDLALDGCIDGSANVALGENAGTSIVHGSNIIAIGAGVTGGGGPFADAPDTCFIGSIWNEPVSDAATAEAVYIDQYNVLGYNPSSKRFKHDIQPMNKTSETLHQLKPVTFKYNSDKKGVTQFGLIAEEVAGVNPDLVLRDKNGQAETVRYEQINAMLLNEFLKEHKKVEAQQATIAELKSTVARQQKGMEVLTVQLSEQAAQIKRVSAKLETRAAGKKIALSEP
jgi:uncharacterized coiled-coil protein SlyX